MRFLSILAFALVLPTLSATIRPAVAAWPHEPNNGNVPLCTAAGEQSAVKSISDGAGGAILAWQDARATGDIYAQRIGAMGIPMWTTNGVALTTTGHTSAPAIASDGAGGAIVTWQDMRTGATRIYAQRISATGSTSWIANGVQLCAAAGEQYEPMIVADGAGGAIVGWRDFRSGSNWDIYLRRISASGVPQWAANGVAVCLDVTSQYGSKMISDGAGGAIVTWYDVRLGTFVGRVFAQRMSAAGEVLWLVDGVTVCQQPYEQADPEIVSDEAGGAIVTWRDFRGGSNFDIYAQHVSAAGTSLWSWDGVSVCVAPGNQLVSAISPDGAGGAIVAWGDHRSGVASDIYAQRISAAGITQWTADGLGLCTSVNNQQNAAIVPDGAGGAIVSWDDLRGGTNNDIYAQRVNGDGSTQWQADGVALCKAVLSQVLPTTVSDGAGGAIVAWSDYRNGANHDVYAQRIDRYGYLGTPEAEIVSVKDVPNDQGGKAKVSWNASYLEAAPYNLVTYYKVFRSLPSGVAATAIANGARLQSLANDEIDSFEPVLFSTTVGVSTIYWEYVASVDVDYLAGYSYPVPTAGDSAGSGNPLTLFLIQARTPGNLHWESQPFSGYSVDNLPPAPPVSFTGRYAAGTTNLRWHRNSENDLAGYRIYRGLSPSFTPGASNLVAALPDSGYADAAGSPHVYKLTALDVHGNESPVATLIPSGTLSVEDAPPLLSFAAPTPNPARGATALCFALSRAGHVRLVVYDLAGRRVVVLRDGELPAGACREAFASRDEAGRELASGLYLVRLEAEGRVLTRRVAVIR